MNFDLKTLDELRVVKIIPVVTVDDTAQALGIAAALLAGGLNVIEITLRTDAALASIRGVKDAYPDMCVGAGTISSGDDLANATAAGADFLVTPGVTPALLDALVNATVSVIPGAQTSSEIMTLSERGFEVIKFFPAEPTGGVNALKALSGPLRQVQFIPTGSIGAAQADGYLALPNVVAVGGSWVATPTLIRDEDWGRIEQNARSIAEL